MEKQAVALVGSDSELLRMVAVAPFAECRELAALLRADRANVKACLSGLKIEDGHG